jgi:lipopolysaccharide export system protein LptA
MTQSEATVGRAAAGLAAALTVALNLLWSAAAVAQTDTHSPDTHSPDTHSKAPIDITADQAEVSNTRCVAIWRGSAEAVQEKTRILADTLTVYSRANGTGSDGKPACGGADRIEADGHVFYVTADQSARGEHAVYTQAKDQIIMTGDVVVVQGKNVARGDRLVITVSTREATMQSNVTGAGKPGRVRAVFYPDKTAQADSPAKP